MVTRLTQTRGGDFDVCGLWDAMEAERRRRDITWRRVLEEMAGAGSQTSAESIHDSQLTKTRYRHVPACARHDRVASAYAQSFVPGFNRFDAPLPLGAPARLLRWNIPAFADAVNAERQRRALTWATEVANELDCSVSQVAGLSRLRYRDDDALAMRITQWLDRPAADFVVAVKP